MKSRILYTGKNIFWGYVSTFLTTILSFVCRTVFIYTIGVDYLGINGLFASVLGVLSLTELGIGTAMNYSLYKPVAENDFEKIKALMQVYKKAYRYVAIVVSLLGLAIFLFLDLLITGAEGVKNVRFYYLIFLFNTVSTYFVSYKYSLVNADQKNYVITNINSVFSILTHAVQLTLLIIFKNYVVYLVAQAILHLLQKIYASVYIDRHYPYLKEKNRVSLEDSEKKKIFSDVKALTIHKIGQISVNQTDNIIISAFINITTVGLVSNYSLISNTVNNFVNIAFSGTIGSLGNLLSSDNNEKHYSVFKVFDFINFWIFSFSTVALISLVQPFVSLMWGVERLLPILPVILFCANNYMVGQRISINNFKVASGIFSQDKYLPLIQSVVNLVVSIVLARPFGLVGVYIGTIVSGFIPSFIRPYIIFKHIFKRSSLSYYVNYFVQLLLTAVISLVCYLINNLIISKLSWFAFFISVAVTAVLPNLVLFLIYYRTEEFKYLKSVILQLIKKFKR